MESKTSILFFTRIRLTPLFITYPFSPFAAAGVRLEGGEEESGEIANPTDGRRKKERMDLPNDILDNKGKIQETLLAGIRFEN